MSIRIDKQADEGQNYRDTREVEESVQVGNSGKYNIEATYYPSGLSTEEHLQHFVMFYINVRGKSKFEFGKRLESVNVSNTGQNKLTNAQLGTGASAIAAGAAGIATGAAGLRILGNQRTQGATRATRIGKTLGVAAASAAVGVGTFAALEGLKNMSDILKPDTSSRISDAIALQVDERPSVRYSVDYANKEVGTLGAALGQLLGSGSSLDSAKSMTGEAGAALLMNLANIPSMLGSGATIKDMKELAGKAKTNPFREVFFEAVDFRTFNFRYKFLPTSARELRNIKRIIDAFKFHMLPELSENGLFLVYPSSFEIVYYFKTKENPYFHKISECVLTDMQVDYGGDDFSSFSDGTPTEISMALTFRETETLSKERARAGF